MEFDFGIVNRAGIKHQAADALSRLPTNCSDRTILASDTPVMVATRLNKQFLSSLSFNAADDSHAEIN